MKKICSKCGIEKELSEFHKQAMGKNGRRAICKICRKKIEQIYRINNKEYIAQQRKQYYIDNKKHITKCHKQYRINNREHLIKYQQQYYKDNPEICKKIQQNNQAKRRGWKKPQPINQPFEGSHLHHLHINRNHQIAIYIPKELHGSIWHAYNRPETMIAINTLAFEWLATQDII